MFACRVFIKYCFWILDPFERGFWENACGETYFFGKVLVRISYCCIYMSYLEIIV
jgi:hypothetical protein